jgi:acyl phosphate:glycerol-3-phosphate acyltransferase
MGRTSIAAGDGRAPREPCSRPIVGVPRRVWPYDLAAVAYVTLVLAYLLGTFPSAALAGRLRGVDPTSSGSGNPGATNVLRTAGRRAGLLTLAGDVGKGALAAGMGWWVGGSHGWAVACGVAAVVGHVAPATRRFRGGKGVATGFGMLLVAFPLLAGVAAVAFLVAAAVSRIASVGSFAAEAAVLVAAAVTGVPGRELAGLAACAAVVLARHGDNIRRLARGEERRIDLSRPVPPT